MGKMEDLRRKFGDKMTTAASSAARPVPAAPTGPNKFAAVTRGIDMGAVLLSEIVPDPHQVRQTFDEVELQALEGSIRAKGILQPLRVRWMPAAGKWQTVAGGKRLEAARRAGLVKVPCLLVEGEMDRADVLEEMLAENEHRSGPPILETAAAWQELMELRGWTQEQLADRLHVRQSRVSETLKLLKLSPEIQADIAKGKIPPHVGVELAKIKDPAEQENIAGGYSAEGMTRDKVRATVKKAKRKRRGAKPAAAPKLYRTPFQVEPGRVWVLESTAELTDDEVLRLARVLVAWVGGPRSAGREAA